jgi:phosphatidylglycerophosphate synthase
MRETKHRDAPARGMIPVSRQNFNAPAAPASRIVGASEAKLYGLSQGERLARALRRAGASPPEIEAAAFSTVLVRADHVFEERLLVDLVRRPGCVLVTDDGVRREPVAAHVRTELVDTAQSWLTRREVPLDAVRDAGVDVVTAVELASSYDEKLRKKSPPLVREVSDGDTRAVERLLFGASYKGVTDFVTKYVWPEPALVVTRWCAAVGLTPNAVTAASALCVLAAMWLFAHGAWLAGLAFAWLMTFLDTVDGKLARVTLTSSRLGNVFDHGVDLVHPPFWYYAWWSGLAAPTDPLVQRALWVIVVGYVVGRLMEGFFLAVFKMEMHAWRPVDSFFRLITARRNPNLALLSVFALCAEPRAGFLAVAVWTLASTAFHAIRIAQAVAATAAGHPPRSWLAE